MNYLAELAAKKSRNTFCFSEAKKLANELNLTFDTNKHDIIQTNTCKWK